MYVEKIPKIQPTIHKKEKIWQSYLTLVYEAYASAYIYLLFKPVYEF